MNNAVKRAPVSQKSIRSILWRFFTTRENQLILCLLLATLLFHLLTISWQTAPFFDEHYYVPEARSIIHEGEITNPEHPPLGKLFIALGIVVFGDNPWGWRTPSIIFATASVLIFYLLSRKLVGKSSALMASSIFTFESLVFTQSGLAMLDVFSVTFMLLAFLLYLRKMPILSGIFLSLSGLCKMTGLLGGLVIVVHWFITRKANQRRSVVSFLLAALMSFVILFVLFDFAATKEWHNPLHSIQIPMSTSEIGEQSLPNASSPIEWLMSPIGSLRAGYAYYTSISLTVWILIIPSMCYLLYEFNRRKMNSYLFVLLWFGATYVILIPVTALTGGPAYLFYFYPTVGAVCIAIGIALAKLWKESARIGAGRYLLWIRGAIAIYLVVHAILFFIQPTQMQAFIEKLMK